MKTVVCLLLLLISSYILQAQTPTTGDSKNAKQGYISNSPLAAGLIRVGKEGNDKVLDAYFSDDFVIHAPGGNMNLTQLKTNQGKLAPRPDWFYNYA